MAGKTIHNIAVTMSADFGQATRQFDNVGKEIKRLERIKSQLAKEGKFNDSIERELIALKKMQRGLIETKNAHQNFFKSISPAAAAASKNSVALTDNARALEILRAKLEQYKDEQRSSFHIAPIQKQIKALEQLEVQAERATEALGSGGKGGAAMSGARKKASRLQQAFGQLSFAVEDFATVYGTMGIRGGFRAAGNNLSQIGHILGGPGMGGLYGGAAGLAAIALPSLWEAFNRTGEETKKVTQNLDDLLLRIDRLQAIKGLDLDLTFSLKKAKEAEGSEAIEKTLEGMEEQEKKLDLTIENLAEKEKELAFRVKQQFKGGSPLAGNETLTKDTIDDVDEAFRILITKVTTAPANAQPAIKAAGREITRIFADELNAQAEKIAEEEFQSSQVGETGSATRDRIMAAKREAMVRLKIDEQRKEFLDDIQSTATSIDTEQLTTNKTINNLVKERAELLESMRIADRKARVDAIKELSMFNRSVAEESLDPVRAKIERIIELGKQSLQGSNRDPTQTQNKVQQIGEDFLQGQIDDLRKEMEKEDKPIKSKGDQIVADSLASQVEIAKQSARAQVEAAQNQKKDKTRGDLLNKLEQMLIELKRNKTIAHQVGP